jgi:DNA replication initiation complex subunit (GINS family)
MADIMILTFEKIRELYWKEKESQKLQEIPEDFFKDSSAYLNGSDETIKSAINDLIDIRQVKIVKMAVMATKSPVAKHHNLTNEEETFFYSILNSLKEFRINITEGKIPVNPEIAQSRQLDEKKAEPPSLQKEEIKEGFCLIRETMPSFIGNDMKTYHLKKGDKVYLPKELMALLVKNGVCERLN